MSVASTFERQMLDLINQERTSRGLDPLTLELRLNDASEDHSTWMDQSGNFGHTGSGGSSPGDRMSDAGFVFSGSWTWGENVAFQTERGAPGIADDVANLHLSLMNSSGHRANILNPNFTVIGIGIEEGDYHGFDSVYVTQNFAKTGAAVQLDIPSGGNPFIGSTGNDTLTGDSGNNRMLGAAGDDRVTGLGGNDTILGGNGADILLGGTGNDIVKGGKGNDNVKGDSGDDIVVGQRGNDMLFGGSGQDIVRGGDGHDVLFGGGGQDKLKGDAGKDRLDGGAGNDRLIGGADADVFVFSTGRDVATDFNWAQSGEKIDLSGVASIVDFNDLMSGGHIRQSGANTVIDDMNGNTLTLLGVDQSDLAVNDFLF